MVSQCTVTAEKSAKKSAERSEPFFCVLNLLPFLYSCFRRHHRSCSSLPLRYLATEFLTCNDLIEKPAINGKRWTKRRPQIPLEIQYWLEVFEGKREAEGENY